MVIKSPFATGNVWKGTGTFSFGLIHYLVAAVISILHWNRDTQVLIVSTVLIVKVDLGWLELDLSEAAEKDRY